MPSITNVTGTLNDDVTAFTLTGVQGGTASTPAVYRDQASTTVPAHQIEVRAKVGQNGARTKTQPRVEFSLPIIALDKDNLPFVKDRSNWTLTGSVPETLAAAVRMDHCKIIGTFLTSDDFKNMVATGFTAS